MGPTLFCDPNIYEHINLLNLKLLMILYSDKLAIIPALNLMLLFYILLCCTFSDLNHKTQTLENPRFGTIATEQKWPESLFQTCKCKKAVSILPHEAKAQLELFCLYSILFD